MKNVIGTVLAGLGIGVVGAGLGAGALALLVVGILLKPLLAILVGWVVGFGLKFIAGSFVAGALSTILHTTITASALPQIFAGLTLLSTYIKPNIVKNGSSVEVQANDLKKNWNDLKKELRNSK